MKTPELTLVELILLLTLSELSLSAISLPFWSADVLHHLIMMLGICAIL